MLVSCPVALRTIAIDMLSNLRRGLVVLACVAAVSCGKSNPTSPDAPETGTPPVSGGGGGGGTGRTAVATDGTFDDNEWDTIVQVSGPGGTADAGHVRFNGQEGADYRRITIRVNGAVDGGIPAQVVVFSIKRTATYFPSSDGAIVSIDYSEDSILLSGSGNGQFSAPALRQNGKLYTLLPGGGAFPTPERSWAPHSVNGLRQDSFRTLASSSDHPDFSAAGGRIEVGFVRIVTVPVGSGPDNQQGGIDNYRMTLYR
jgi:hypothetical protein